MKNIIKGQVVVLVSLLAALTVTLAACGGGGSSSAGGGSSVRAAVVAGTVTGGATAGLHMDITGTASMIAVVSDLFIGSAHAAGVAGVVVVLDCGNGAVYQGVTDAGGKFKILVPDVGTGTCSTTFNGLGGPTVAVTEGMETEVEVSYDGAEIANAKVEQRPDSSTQVEIEVENDQNSSDDVASSDDDQNSSDTVSNDDEDSSDTASNDDDDEDSDDDQDSSDSASNDDVDSSDDDNDSGASGTG